MRRLSRLLLPTALTGLLLSCGQDTLAPVDEVDLVQAASSNANETAQERWVSEYFTPLVAQSYGLRTYRCTYGCDEGEQEFTSEIVGEETVPYQTGALTGVRVWYDDAEIVVYVENRLLYFLGEESYYFSTDCNLTEPPSQAVLGNFVNGMILDNSGTFYEVNKDNPADCVQIVTPAVDGGVDSGVTLMQIQDVRVGGKKYNNALLMWELEPYLEFPGFDELGSQYLEQELGITLPTWDDIKGAAINPLGPSIDDLLIFGFHEGPIAQIFVGNSDGEVGGIWELVSNVRPPWPSPFGSKIAFVSDRDDDPDPGRNWEIYVMNADGSGQTRLTDNPARDLRPRWSPNGQKIAFWSDRDGHRQVYVMNADGSGQTNLTNHPTANDDFPRWSPNGQRIAFDSDRDGDFEVYVMNADGSGQTNLTNNPSADDGDSDWSPNGQKIAFISDRDDDPDPGRNWEIYVMNADGSGQTRLTSSPSGDFRPSWSPNGQKIVFNSRRDGNLEVYVMNADGSGQTRLTDNPATDGTPRWSPDGRMIAFSSDRDGSTEVYVMNADGSGQTRVTNNPARDIHPDWASGRCQSCR